MNAKQATRSLGYLTVGVSSKRQDHELSTTMRVDGEPRRATFLRTGSNIDFTRHGTVKRRRGYALSIPGDAVHSLFSTSDRAFCADGDTLYELTGDPSDLSRTAVFNGLTPSRYVSYAEAPSGVLYTDGHVLRRITNDGDEPLAAPAPNSVPSASASTGLLRAGRYQVAFAYERANGEQSALSEPAVVTLGDNGGILVSGLPTVRPAGVEAVLVFATTPNGSTFFLQRRLFAALSSIELISFNRESRSFTHMLRELPPGQIVRFHNGRTLVAHGSLLLWSEPYNSGLYEAEHNFVAFPKRVSIIQPCGNGFFVVADQTYWLDGDFTQASLRVVSGATGVEWSGFTEKSDDGDTAYWLSDHGIARGRPDGTVTFDQDAELTFAKARAGAAVKREVDGMEQIIGSYFGAGADTASAYSYMDAEIIRKGEAS